MSCSITFINVNRFEETEKRLTILGLDFGFTHSSLFQYNRNLQSLHRLLASYSFILFYPAFLVFLLSLGLLNGGSPLEIISIYHPPPISVISFWTFCFGLSALDIVRDILLNISFIELTYASHLAS